MKILHIDDHPLFSKGLQAALSQKMKRHTFLSAADCVAAMETIESSEPDLILLDLVMPGVSGVEFMHQLIDKQLNIPIAIFSADEDASRIKQALDLGAIAFLSKEWSEVELAQAIDAIEQGDMVIPNHIQSLINALNTHSSSCGQQNDVKISKRQLDVLRLLAQGLSNKEIAHALEIGENTVKTHIKALFQVFSSKNRVDCVNRARENNLV